MGDNQRTGRQNRINLPGMAKNADPTNSPHNPPQKAPVLPQRFIRSPAL